MNKYTNLFIRQSYLDSYDEYEKSLVKANYPVWDYVVLTASNEDQAAAYRHQIDYRMEKGRLPVRTQYIVLADPDGQRVGSGGATLNVLRNIKGRTGGKSFEDLKILVIHSGGDSKRVPQYSACGKLFSPVPRQLPDGRRSTLFDEFIISFTGIPARIGGGMLVASGDVLLLFNPLQIDFYGSGAAALSIKEHVLTGQHHGVYLRDESGNVARFLHKQSEATLRSLGAVDTRDNIDIDTGAVFFDYNMLEDLYSLVNTDEKFTQYVNSKVRLSFYADFLFPLASESSLEDYLLETPEGEFSDELTVCRRAIWELLHKYNMKLIRFSPASFIHFGTTAELLSLLTTRIDDFLFLDWKGCVGSNVTTGEYAASNSYIDAGATIGRDSYIEDSYVFSDAVVGRGSVISGVTLRDVQVPDDCVLHGLKLRDGHFVARMYGVSDNPKEPVLFGSTALDEPLWDAPLYPVCDTMEEAVHATLDCIINHAVHEGRSLSLRESFNEADTTAILPWQDKLSDYVSVESLYDAADRRLSLEEAHRIFPFGISQRASSLLEQRAEDLDISDERLFSIKLRLYYYMADFATGQDEERYIDLCFKSLSQGILNKACEGITYRPDYHIRKDEVITYLPVRVNWGGGWSDTPPYCIEHGGTVLNAAVTLFGKKPVEVVVRQTDARSIVLASADNGSYHEFTDIRELQDCNNPFDAFALHKAALIATGLIPMSEYIPLETILDRLGGGIYLSTQVINIPRGSGLGTSSILAAACVKGIYEFLGLDEDFAGSRDAYDNELYNRVLCMEQIMSTGGGWQDQVGGLVPGIKLITSTPGLKQEIRLEHVNLSPETMAELKERFCIIYTGQRRLARNLLREVVGKYIASDPDACYVLEHIRTLAIEMKDALTAGDLDRFAALLNEHWEMSKRLDHGCTNTCIDQIFVSCDDLIDGRMICGAGGGGFIQVILKKGVTHQELKDRLDIIFADSGVDVWECEF